MFTTRAVGTVLEETRGEIERRTGDTSVRRLTSPFASVRRVKAGEAFDLLVAAPVQIDELIAENMIVRETRTDIAHSGIGIAVRRGATKPDVSSLAAFTRALINAPIDRVPQGGPKRSLYRERPRSLWPRGPNEAEADVARH